MSGEQAPLLPRTRVIEVGADRIFTTDNMNGGAAFWHVGALFGAAGVGLGAFGAHGLKNRVHDQQQLANWATAAQYQLIHSGVLLVARGNPVAATCFTLGMTMFSGSIYALVLDPDTFKPLGPVTPIGGLFLIAGWIVLLFSKSPRYLVGYRP